MIRTAPMWMNVLLDDTALVTDYLDDPIVLLDRPDQYQVRLRAAADAFSEAYEDARAARRRLRRAEGPAASPMKTC